jgi:uncharacterized Ntn-hydrolase superfamily protein
MRAASLLVVVAIAGCSRQRAPEAERPAPSDNRYCRRAGAFTLTGAGGAVQAGAGAGPATPLRPVHTYSIVARDPATGELGVAVQSHWFSVGALVSWAEPGVGAIATQSFVDPSYGPRGLELMRGGASAADALARLLAEDQARDVRQVAFIDATGRAAAHTGAKNIEYAGHQVGDGFSVQANMMGNEKVVPAMARAYETTDGDLAARRLGALAAAQAAGGDVRGCQSAALLVVKGARSEKPWADRRFDLRVDDSPDPIAELTRLVTLARAYEHMNQGDAAVEKGDMAGALQHYGTAAEMSGGNVEMLFWQAVALANNGDVERAIPLFRTVYADDPRWIELTRRLHKPGIFPDTPEGRALVDRIVREAR